MIEPSSSAIHALSALVFVLALAGCQDFEQGAKAQGRAAREASARACAAADAGAIDGEACVANACANACVDAGAGAAKFQRMCAAACAGTGECIRDDDCAAGLTCVAIAPVVRRCTPARSDGGP